MSSQHDLPHPPWRVLERSISLRNYVTAVSIGIYEHEKLAPQRVSLSVTLETEPLQTVGEDAIESVLDYDFIRNTIDELVASQHFELQETLCERIMLACLAKEQVLSVRVASSKMDVYPNCDSIGIEVYCRKTNPCTP